MVSRQPGWRAPTDNDLAPHGEPLAPQWRSLGLDRLRHRLVGVEVLADELVVRHRVGAATTDIGFDVTYRWSTDGRGVRVAMTMEPDGELSCPLPRVGLRLAVPRVTFHPEKCRVLRQRLAAWKHHAAQHLAAARGAHRQVADAH